MTPPSLTVAREILANEAARMRAGEETDDRGYERAMLVASAIDVVLAALDQSVHGAASVITVALAADPRPASRPAQCQRGYGAIMCRLDAGHAGDHVSFQFGSRRVWSEDQLAQLRVDHGAPPDPPRATTTHGTAIPAEALVDNMLPCPFCRSTTLSVNAQPCVDYPRVTCGECGTRGPLARSDSNREAIANWNRRPQPRASGERPLAAAVRSLLEDLGLTPSGTGSEDLGLLEVEIERLRAGRASTAALAPVFESRDGRDRGDVSDVKALRDRVQTQQRGAIPCQMMIARQTTYGEGLMMGEPCGATPTVGGNGVCRYCEAHMQMAATCGATTLTRDAPDSPLG